MKSKAFEIKRLKISFANPICRRTAKAIEISKVQNKTALCTLRQIQDRCSLITLR